MKLFFAAIMFLAMLSVSASALELPANLKLITDYTIAQAQSVTVLVAFLGGVLSIFSPCILPFLPAYLAFTFREKNRLLLATAAFFAGFALIFIFFGIAIALIGSVFQDLRQFLIPIAGVVLVAFGVMTALGMGFSFGGARGVKTSSDLSGAFILGTLFATGWTACMGPVLGSILVIAGTAGQPLYGAFLMLAYSLGIFVPLFLLSIFSESAKIYQHPLLSKELFSIELSGVKRQIFLSSLLSGILLILLGLVFIIFNGTSVFNDLDPLGNKIAFTDLQRQVQFNPSSEAIAFAFLTAFAAIIIFYLWKKQK